VPLLPFGKIGRAKESATSIAKVSADLASSVSAKHGMSARPMFAMGGKQTLG
jgi:hypothetical protein